ncbi:MAG TPA: sigma-70 family RNA polymerase sigma factor [Luteolibacter sp.]
MVPTNPDDRSSGFLSHILQSQQDLRNYLFHLHPHAQDLDDLMQETSLKLWQEFDDFDPERPFLPWAMRITYFQVLRFRKTRSRDRLVFSEELVEILAGEAPVDGQTNVLRSALDDCLGKLTPRARETLLARYAQDSSIADLASARSQSVHGLYRLLNQARTQLATCIRRHLHIEGEWPLPEPSH